MILFQWYIIAIALMTSYACLLPGTFLVLQGNALVADAMSHSILLGIVLSFLYTKSLHSPWLFAGALAMSLVTVLATHWLKKIPFLRQDAAIGILFPFFFACAVIIITMYSSHVHIDTDAVLLGELAFTPFDVYRCNGINYGPIALWTMTTLTILNALCIYFFYKEFLLSSFDTLQARLQKYCPTLWHYLLMILVSLSIIGAFQAVGTILVLSFIIVPPATARMLTNSLHEMIILSLLLATLAVLIGYYVAHFCNASIAGSIALINGILFLLTFIYSSKKI